MVSREKYDILKEKAEKWRKLSIDYYEEITSLKEVVEKLESSTDTSDVSKELKRCQEEMKNAVVSHKNEIKELEEKHKDQMREMKYDFREKMSDIKNELRLKEGELMSEKRTLLETVKYWKELYEEEVRKRTKS